MITKFTCTCGNTNPKKAKAYDSLMGYEAIICTDCGRYYDHIGEHDADEFSKSYVGIV